MGAPSSDDVLSSLPGEMGVAAGGSDIAAKVKDLNLGVNLPKGLNPLPEDPDKRTLGGGSPSGLYTEIPGLRAPAAAAPPPVAGVSPDLAQKIIGVEKSGQNPNSSAVGIGQFIDPSWLAITQGEPEVAGKTQDQILQMRVDNPAFATRMVQKATSQNISFLQHQGLPVNDTTVYMVHFLGGEGAKRVLTAPPNTPLSKLFMPSVLQANPNLAGLTTSNIGPYLAKALNSSAGTDGTGGGDPLFDQYRQAQEASFAHTQSQVDILLKQMSQAPPGSDEMHRLLRQAMDRSQELASRFDKLSQKPPESQSPIEAASSFTPLLIGLVSMMGRRTRRPGLAAINAMSAGLGALKQGNDEAYKRSMDLWSKQTELASKAFDMQNKTIDNIMKDLDLSAKEQQDKLQNAFRVLGLEHDLDLAKAGLWKDVYERQDNRLKLQTDIEEKRSQIDANRARAAKDQAIAKAGGSNSPSMVLYNRKLEAYRAAHGGEEPDPQTSEKLLTDALREAKAAGPGHQSTEQKALDDAFIAKANELGVDPDSFKNDPKYAGQRRDIERDTMSLHHNIAITGNEKVKLESRVTQYNQGLQKIEDLEGILANNNFVAGVGGKVTRPLEALENVLSWSHSTDKAQFESGIQYLKAISAELLLGQSNSRGVVSELYGKESRIDYLIRGLKMGDTTDRTVESLRELKATFLELGRQTHDMLQGTWQAPSWTTRDQPGAAPPAPAPSMLPPTTGSTDDWSDWARP